MRTVSPTGGMLLKSFFATSDPRNATRRRFSHVLVVQEPPVAGLLGAHQPYSGATPRTPAVVDRVP